VRKQASLYVLSREDTSDGSIFSKESQPSRLSSRFIPSRTNVLVAEALGSKRNAVRRNSIDGRRSAGSTSRGVTGPSTSTKAVVGFAFVLFIPHCFVFSGRDLAICIKELQQKTKPETMKPSKIN
jgi:hypothetical protein